MVRKHSPEQIASSFVAANPPTGSLSRRLSLVSGVSTGAQNLFRKRKSLRKNSSNSAKTDSQSYSNGNTNNGNSKSLNNATTVPPQLSQEMSVYIYQVILGLPNVYRDRFNAPFPTNTDEYMDCLIELLPKEWPELATSSALKRMTALQYPSFPSFQHFLWEFRRLKLVAQCPDRKAFHIFLAILPTDLRLAISRSGINQYSQLHRVEEYDKPSTRNMALDPRSRKQLRLDLHKDRLLFALHVPSSLFNKISKSKHKLIDSLAMSWSQLLTNNLFISTDGNQRSVKTAQSTGNTPTTLVPSYLYADSSKNTLPILDYSNDINDHDYKNSNNDALTKDNTNSQTVVISDNIVYYNNRIHLSQSLMASVIKHWYHCFTADVQRADVQIFNSLKDNNFSYKPLFDFSRTLSSNLGPKSSKDSFNSLIEDYGIDFDYNSTQPTFSETGYYKPWQVVKISYVKGADLFEFANSTRPLFQPDDSLTAERSNSSSSRTSGSNGSSPTSFQQASYISNVDIRRADSQGSSSSTVSSNDPSLFSFSNSLRGSVASYDTSATSTITTNVERLPNFSAQHQRYGPIEEESDQNPPKDFIILTCCETLEVYLVAVDPKDPLLAVIQTVFIPFAHNYGYPLALLTDRSAPNKFFTSKLFQSFWKAHGTATFHQGTVSSDATSISAIHINFVKTYLACFARELHQGSNDRKTSTCSESWRLAKEKSGHNLKYQQHSLGRKAGPDSGCSRTSDMARYIKRLMAALNDFIAYYDTNGGDTLSKNLHGRSASGPSSRSCSLRNRKSILGLKKSNDYQSGGNVKRVGSMPDPLEPSQVGRNKSITKTENTNASFTLFNNDQEFSEIFSGVSRSSSAKYYRHMSPEDFGKPEEVDSSSEDDDGSDSDSDNDTEGEEEEEEDFSDGYRDTIFYQSLTTALKLFTRVTDMHSTRCKRMFDTPIEPDLNKGHSSWATVIPWKFADNVSSSINSESLNSSSPPSSCTRKRLSTNLSKYCDYYESLGQPQPGHSPPRPAKQAPITKTPRDHVIIHDAITSVVSILGCCEYLGIPCFLIETDARYAPGVAWVTGFQFTQCSRNLRASIRSVYKSSGQEVPSTVKYLVSSITPGSSPSQRLGSKKKSTQHFENFKPISDLKIQSSFDFDSSPLPPPLPPTSLLHNPQSVPRSFGKEAMEPPAHSLPLRFVQSSPPPHLPYISDQQYYGYL